MQARRTAALLAIGAVAAYAGLTGFRPSTCRAAAIAIFMLFGIATDRAMPLPRALGLIAISFLLLDVDLLWDPGAQLSFAAVTGIALTPRLPDGLPRAVRWVLGLLSATAVAGLATFPIAAFHFQQVPTIGVLANVLAVPLVSLVVLPLGVVGILSMEWCTLFLDVACSVATIVLRLARGASLLFPVVSVPPPSVLAWSGVVAVFASFLKVTGWGYRWRAVSFLTGIVFVVAAARQPPLAAGSLRVSILDVGQGDASVAIFPDGRVWLIDSGGDAWRPNDARARNGSAPGRAVHSFLENRGVRTLDVVVLSHAHPDHTQGLWSLLGNFTVRQVWVPCPLNGRFGEVLDELRKRGTRVTCPGLGTIGYSDGSSATVLGPGDEDRALTDPVMSENDNSLVLRVSFAGRSVLFTGDIEEEAEELLVESNRPLAADVVKVPHHGSSTSSTDAFIRATGAAWAVVSAGRGNRFGFPAKRVVARWGRHGASVVSTQENGAVQIVVAPGGGLSVRGTVGTE